MGRPFTGIIIEKFHESLASPSMPADLAPKKIEGIAMLDTGAEGCSVTEEVIRKLDLQAIPGLRIQGKPDMIAADPEARRVYLGESFSV